MTTSLSGKLTALITGVTGQDGVYLAELLLDKGYRVIGMARRRSQHSDQLAHLSNAPNFHVVEGDLTDASSLARIVMDVQPHEVYNLAAQSFVGVSWQQPLYTSQATGMGALHMLEAVRVHCPLSRYYQASSSEMFGTARGARVQNEDTPFEPRSPYAVAKVFAHHMTVNYRQSFGMHASCGILFNHESPRRGMEFVTRKITHGVARIKLGLTHSLVLGNTDASRDWGHARDYVEAMWRMLQQDEPDDYVIATGRTITVRDFAELVFNIAGLNVSYYLAHDTALMRPAEVPCLQGDASKAMRKLNWQASTDLVTLAEEMYENDLQLLKGA